MRRKKMTLAFGNTEIITDPDLLYSTVLLYWGTLSNIL